MSETSTMPTFAPADVIRIPQADGGFIVRSAQSLPTYPDRITDHLVRWAKQDPERVFLAERNENGGWTTLSYAGALTRARSIGQHLLNLGCGPDAPVASISENSIELACLSLGALYAGVPHAPISPSYAGVAAAYDKLEACMAALRPRVVFLGSPDAHARAAARACEGMATVFMSTAQGVTELGGSVDAEQSPSVELANRNISGDSVAKYLFTSGSTGAPKAVINTHRMLCANQEQFAALWPFVRYEPPVLVDWLPWHHTFGGNEVFFLAMSRGGTLYIDAGRPVESSIEKSISNLKEISPTIYFNVPVGFDQLVVRMENDTALRDNFFRRLRMAFYSGAGMPQRTWNRLEEMCLQSTGRSFSVVTAWGATETAPLSTGVHFESHRSDNIGLPAPGCDIKFAPVGGRYELRVKGPNVMPGYLGRPEVTARSFDEDGYYCTGDAAKLADEQDPSAGIIFGGRIAEDFKLRTGVWVSVGRLRGLLQGELSPIASHVVVAGADRESIGLAIFISLQAARDLTGLAQMSLQEAAVHPLVIQYVRDGIARHNEKNPGASMRVGSHVVLREPPSVEAKEITDKGSINQAAVLAHRAAELESMWDR